jgi:hypothetical protein
MGFREIVAEASLQPDLVYGSYASRRLKVISNFFDHVQMILHVFKSRRTVGDL